jgi:hypothetical protein
MSNRADFELKIVESLEAYPIREEREGTTAADLVATPAEVLESLKATRGAPVILKRLPQLENIKLWFSTAYFSVCGKSGTARYLDLWDTDHFDGVTDMQRCVQDCRAWFSGDGYGSWGSALSANMSETATSWKFSVEGEQGLEDDERTGTGPWWTGDRGDAEGNAAAVHGRVQAEDRPGGGRL